MIDWLINAAHAAGPQMGGQGAPGNPIQQMMSILPFLALIAGLYYVMIYMPQKKRRKERDTMFTNLKRGDDVLTAGGIYGKITGIADQNITIEIAPKVKIKLLKSSVNQVVAQAQEEESKE